MNIIIFGASGLIGSALVKSLLDEYQVTVAGRDLAKLQKMFPALKCYQNETALSKDVLKEYDVVINLVGENIASAKWSQKQKQRIVESRVTLTAAIAKLCCDIGSENAPKIMNASAIGIYGLQKTIALQNATVYTENSPLPEPPNDFLACVGKTWEQALSPAVENGVRVVKLRFAVVLAKRGGALAKMLPAFKLGLGSILGSGNQPFSWVSLDDVVAAIIYLVKMENAEGAYNIVAPGIVTQKQFAKTLAKALQRPCWLTMPSFLVKILFGEMAEELLLNGQKVESQRLLASGFKFRHSHLQDFFAEMKNRNNNEG